MDNKKAQEEMTGFVIIVVMLIIMGVAFLFIARPTVQERTDLQTANLLSAILESTENGVKLRDMVYDCSSNINCDRAKSNLETRLKTSLSTSGLVIGRTLKGYSLTASKPGGTFINITNGSLTGSLITGLAPIQNVDVILRFYY
jgi:hypothetical protein